MDVLNSAGLVLYLVFILGFSYLITWFYSGFQTHTLLLESQFGVLRGLLAALVANSLPSMVPR